MPNWNGAWCQTSATRQSYLVARSPREIGSRRVISWPAENMGHGASGAGMGGTHVQPQALEYLSENTDVRLRPRPTRFASLSQIN